MNWRQYFGPFAVLMTGSAFAQLINFAAYPLIGRLYSPSAFGMFALFLTICAVPGAIACGRFELVIPTVRHSARFAAYWLCIGISLAIALVAVAVAAGYSLIAGPSWNPMFVALFGVTIFLTGFCAASSLFLMRHNGYRMTSSAIVVRTAAAVGSQIGLAFVAPSALSLVVGFCVGLLAQAVTLAANMPVGLLRRRASLRQMHAVFRRYRRQVSVDVPSTIVAVTTLNMMNVLLLSLYNAATVGVYSLANRIVIVPFQLFNDALSQVFFQKAARAEHENGTFWPEFRFNLFASAGLSIVVIVGIWLFARPFVSFYLGAKWNASAEILIVLAPMLALQGTTMSIATSVFVLKRVHWLLFHNLAMVAMHLIAYAFATIMDLALYDYLVTVAVLTGAEYAVFATCLAVIVRNRDRAAWQEREAIDRPR